MKTFLLFAALWLLTGTASWAQCGATNPTACKPVPVYQGMQGWNGILGGPWTTATRPSAASPPATVNWNGPWPPVGLTGFNSTIGAYETWNGSAWIAGSGTAPAGSLTGTTLAPNVVNSSLLTVSLGTLGTAAIASTGTAGHFLPYLDGANTWSGTNTWTGAFTNAGIVFDHTFLSALNLAMQMPPGQGVGWYDGTGTASITGTEITSGNVDVTIAPAGTGTVRPKSVDNVLYCSQYASLQACHNALPSTGGKMLLPPNTTYLLTTVTTISKPNVKVVCPSWATVLQRGAGSAMAQILNFTSAAVGSGVEDCTFDGNGGTFTGYSSDLALQAASNYAQHVQAINGGGSIQIAVSGANGRISNSTVTGLNSTTVGGYGIWAIAHVPVKIDHNTVSNTTLDGIGVDGTGSIVESNHLFNDHCFTGTGGGQIAVYPGYSGITIANNTIDTGCTDNTFGIELNGQNITVVGNTVNNQKWGGITLDVSGAGSTPGTLISSNTVRNSGQVLHAGANAPYSAALSVSGVFSGLTVTGNRFIDDQGSPTQTYGVYLFANATDNLVVTGNDFTGNLTGAASDGATGTNQTWRSNLGVDNLIPSVASATALAFPLNPTISLTGTTTVTSITGTAWTGRQVTLIPTGAVSFTATNNIGNAVTTSANVPIVATYNGTNWYLK